MYAASLHFVFTLFGVSCRDIFFQNPQYKWSNFCSFMPCLDQEKWSISVGSECSNQDLWALGIRNRQENLWIFVCFNFWYAPGTPNNQVFLWLFQLDDSKSLHQKCWEIFHQTSMKKNGCLGYKRQGWKFGNSSSLLKPKNPWILQHEFLRPRFSTGLNQSKSDAFRNRPSVFFFFFWFLCAPQAPLEPRKGGGGEFRLRLVAFGTTF